MVVKEQKTKNPQTVIIKSKRGDTIPNPLDIKYPRRKEITMNELITKWKSVVEM